MKPHARVSPEDVTLPSREVLTEADFERMALEAETAMYDIEDLRRTAKRRTGRPPPGDGPSFGRPRPPGRRDPTSAHRTN